MYGHCNAKQVRLTCAPFNIFCALEKMTLSILKQMFMTNLVAKKLRFCRTTLFPQLRCDGKHGLSSKKNSFLFVLDPSYSMGHTCTMTIVSKHNR